MHVTKLKAESGFFDLKIFRKEGERTNSHALYKAE
jgi:hypothetical protein